MPQQNNGLSMNVYLVLFITIDLFWLKGNTNLSEMKFSKSQRIINHNKRGNINILRQ